MTQNDVKTLADAALAVAEVRRMHAAFGDSLLLAEAVLATLTDADLGLRVEGIDHVHDVLATEAMALVRRCTELPRGYELVPN